MERWEADRPDNKFAKSTEHIAPLSIYLRAARLGILNISPLDKRFNAKNQAVSPSVDLGPPASRNLSPEAVEFRQFVVPERLRATACAFGVLAPMLDPRSLPPET
jgi:hypothetical protein